MEFKEMQRKLYWLGSCSMKMSIEKEIRELQAECRALREYKSVNLDGMPHGNTVGDTIGDKVAKIVDIYDKRIEELGKKLEKQLAEKDKLYSLISTLTVEEQDVIRAKYIYRLRWEYIPGRVNMSRRRCFYEHKKAIQKLIESWNKSLH